MKVYIVKCPYTGLYFQGHRGWGKKPRIYKQGALKLSMLHNHTEFQEFAEMGLVKYINAVHAAGDEFRLLHHHNYQVKEFIIE